MVYDTAIIEGCQWLNTGMKEFTSIHNHHNLEVIELKNSYHYGKIHCLDCDKHVAFLSRTDLEILLDKKIKKKTLDTMSEQ